MKFTSVVTAGLLLGAGAIAHAETIRIAIGH